MTLASEGRTELTLAGGGCSCCAAPAHSAPAVEHLHGRADAAAPGLPAHSAVFGVAGMTCDNCVRHVTEELGDLYGVASVDVVLVAGGVATVTVRSTEPVDDKAIAGAVAEAGYRVVAR